MECTTRIRRKNDAASLQLQRWYAAVGIWYMAMPTATQRGASDN